MSCVPRIAIHSPEDGDYTIANMKNHHFIFLLSPFDGVCRMHEHCFATCGGNLQKSGTIAGNNAK